MDYAVDYKRIRVVMVDGTVISGLLNINGHTKLSGFMENDTSKWLKLTNGHHEGLKYSVSTDNDSDDFRFMLVNKRNISVIL